MLLPTPLHSAPVAPRLPVPRHPNIGRPRGHGSTLPCVPARSPPVRSGRRRCRAIDQTPTAHDASLLPSSSAPLLPGQTWPVRGHPRWPGAVLPFRKGTQIRETPLRSGHRRARRHCLCRGGPHVGDPRGTGAALSVAQRIAEPGHTASLPQSNSARRARPGVPQPVRNNGQAGDPRWPHARFRQRDPRRASRATA